jgi:hypothetical protein
MLAMVNVRRRHIYMTMPFDLTSFPSIIRSVLNSFFKSVLRILPLSETPDSGRRNLISHASILLLFSSLSAHVSFPHCRAHFVITLCILHFTSFLTFLSQDLSVHVFKL